MHVWWQNKIDKSTANGLQFRRECRHQGQSNPGVAHSVTDWVIHYCYDGVKAICWNLNAAVWAGDTRTGGTTRYTHLRLHCECKLSSCVNKTQKKPVEVCWRYAEASLNDCYFFLTHNMLKYFPAYNRVRFSPLALLIGTRALSKEVLHDSLIKENRVR